MNCPLLLDFSYFYYKRHKTICPCCNFISKRQLKIIKPYNKGFDRSVYWNEYKRKGDNKNTTNEFSYFLKSNFVWVNRIFALVYPNKDDVSEIFKGKKYNLTKGIINNYIAIINGKNFYDQAIDSNIKLYKGIWNLATGQGEDYSNGCLLDYEYLKNYYRLIAVNFSRQKELDADQNSIQQIELVR